MICSQHNRPIEDVGFSVSYTCERFHVLARPFWFPVSCNDLLLPAFSFFSFFFWGSWTRCTLHFQIFNSVQCRGNNITRNTVSASKWTYNVAASQLLCTHCCFHYSVHSPRPVYLFCPAMALAARSVNQPYLSSSSLFFELTHFFLYSRYECAFSGFLNYVF